MTQNTLRIALVGAAGKVAAHSHLNALPMVERAELAALCDLDAKKLDQLPAAITATTKTPGPFV